MATGLVERETCIRSAEQDESRDKGLGNRFIKKVLDTAWCVRHPIRAMELSRLREQQDLRDLCAGRPFSPLHGMSVRQLDAQFRQEAERI